MSERYSKLFALPENLYAEGAPLVIAAGALLKDNQTGKVLAQLKFHSISSKEIKAVKVKVTPMDTVSNPLGEEVEYQYLDLTARRCDEFGQKFPIALPNAATRSFSAEVCEVAFADNTVWRTKGEPWEKLKKPISISTAIPDHELRKQIKLEYGNSFAYIPATDKDLWICSCGELNRKGEHTCVRCRQELSRLLSMDMEDLKAKRDARVDAEKAKAKKYTKLAVMITPILIALILILGMVQKNSNYKKAVALLDAGEYENAISAFEKLGNYKDSKERYENAEAKLNPVQFMAKKILNKGKDLSIGNFSGKAIEKEDNPYADEYNIYLAVRDNQTKVVSFVVDFRKTAYSFIIDLDEECMTKYSIVLIDGNNRFVIEGDENVQGYTSEQEMIPISYSVYDNVTGEKNKYVQLSDGWERSFARNLTLAYSNFAQMLDAFIEESNLNLTMKDLGFESYQG